MDGMAIGELMLRRRGVDDFEKLAGVSMVKDQKTARIGSTCRHQLRDYQCRIYCPLCPRANVYEFERPLCATGLLPRKICNIMERVLGSPFQNSEMLRLTGFPYKKKVAVIYRIMWSLFPPNLLSKAIELLAFATATAKSDGISWSKRSECSVPDCVITTGTGQGKVETRGKHGQNPNVAVQIRGLVKTYPGKIEIGCCKLTRKSHFDAVKGIWLNIPKDQLFCLLGPNGAGKTTSISCLTGIAPVTSGDALIYGHSVRSSVGMTNIRKIIGVCPQYSKRKKGQPFDILWDTLTGEEHLHLHLFASIKGLPDSSIKLVAQKSLAEVRLTEAAQRRAGSYSGGMKRCLSVAIGLIGDPKLVILDEPTTGMDPITRRHVWDIIENAKKGRAIILTTHSMEEADILSDRIRIVAKGTLRCIGTSIRLKSRFGSGIVANMSFTDTATSEEEAIVKTRHEALKKFFKHHLNVVPKEETNYFLSYVIANEKEHLLTNYNKGKVNLV
ncbi:hypothetical protein CsSME_00053488 [Camellia sinensis var. sinensis]